MEKKTVLFISTNTGWGGSEVLWSLTAKRLSETHEVFAAALYDYQYLAKAVAPAHFIELHERGKFPNGILGRISRRLRRSAVSRMAAIKPDLVVISQGNNLAGQWAMEFCAAQAFPFITVTQLVMENSWPLINNAKVSTLKPLYDQARANYFVSKHALTLHRDMMGGAADNEHLIFNPFSANTVAPADYPEAHNGQYHVAIVGRLEVFHKGIDLLFAVLAQEKWKNRPVTFTFFGDGPHRDVLKRWKQERQIDNISIKDHLENVADIWRSHQLLLMPSRMEGQSLSLIEAMRFRRSAIVTRVGGVEELVEDGVSGFIAPSASVDHIDQAMERAWERRAEWKLIGENAFRSITANHPEDAVTYFIDQLAEVLEHRTGRI